MTTAKLGIYLVETKAIETGLERINITIAESADQALDLVCTYYHYTVTAADESGSVGRIGDYDPGITGHRMTMQLGVILGTKDA